MTAEISSYSSDRDDYLYDPKYIFSQIFGSKINGHVQKWPYIRMDELRELNPDTCGWIHLDASPINYPMVRERSDGYYLKHNFSREPSAHGAVTVYSVGQNGFSRYNTVITAHQMKDWSMFMCMVSYDEQKYYDRRPVIDMILEDKRYDIRVFAAMPVIFASAYEKTDFSNSEEYAQWLSALKKCSRIKTPVTPSVSDSVVTFITCNDCPEPEYIKYNGYGVYGIVREHEER